jgi:hypothetical protein
VDARVHQPQRQGDPDKQQFAQQLSDALTALQMTPFLDLETLRPANDWPETLERNARDADAGVLLISKKSLRSKFMRRRSSKAARKTIAFRAPPRISEDLLAGAPRARSRPTDSMSSRLLALVQRHGAKRTRDGMCMVGKRNRALDVAALEEARRLADTEVAAARWVSEDALRKLTGAPVKRRPMARRGRKALQP